jgi:GH15 family glucan-1,4-alpha-glucosidase
VLDSILLHTRHSRRLPRRLWPIVQSQAECATGIWRQPDQGIWEARGKPQQYVSSKLMCWVALDRAAKLGEIRGDPQLQAGWQATADEIRADILEHGVRDGVLRQHYETDASTPRRCSRRSSASFRATTRCCANRWRRSRTT